MRHRADEHHTLLAAFMVTLSIASIMILVRSAPGSEVPASRSLVITLLQSIRTRSSARTAPLATPAPADTPPTPIIESAPDASGPPVPRLVVGGQARVVKTDGLGLILHAAPNTETRRPAGLLEGTTVTILELASDEWARVQAETQQVGWVPTGFLAPID
jgi:hypothetical protein